MKLGARPIFVSQMKPQTFSSLKQGNLSIIQLIVCLGFLLCVGGNIRIGMASKFELDKFAIAPTVEQFEQCRKDDLLLIADFYNIAVRRYALKREIREALHTELVKQKVLPGVSVVTGVATVASSEDLETAEAELKSEDIARIDPVNPPPKGLLMEIRLKELDVELCRQQYQNQLLQVRAVELEVQRDIRLKELEVELKIGLNICSFCKITFSYKRTA